MEKRKIHIDLNEDTHKRLRVKAAIEDVSIQKFVEMLISKAVAEIQMKELEAKEDPSSNPV